MNENPVYITVKAHRDGALFFLPEELLVAAALATAITLYLELVFGLAACALVLFVLFRLRRADHDRRDYVLAFFRRHLGRFAVTSPAVPDRAFSPLEGSPR